MVRVVFTPNLQRHIACPPAEVEARPCARRSTPRSPATRARAPTCSTTRRRCASTWWCSSTAARPRPRPPLRRRPRGRRDYVMQACPGLAQVMNVGRVSMSDRILVATRKGLFTLARGGGAWRIARADFLGDHVSMVLADPRDGALYAGARPRPLRRQAAPLRRRRRVGGDRAPRLSREARGRRGQRPVGPAHPVVDLEDLGAGAGGAGRDRACSGAARSPAACSAPTTAARAGSSCARCGTARGARSGSAAAPTSPASTRSASTRATQARAGRVSCGGVWTTRRRRDLGLRGSRHARRLHAARAADDPDIQDPHRIVQCRAEPDRLWAQHHNGIFRSRRRRQGVARDHGSGALDVRLRRRRASRRSRHRLVRARDQGREAHPGRRQGRRHAHARRRQELRDAAPAACRRSTPTTSSTATRSTSTRAASAWPSARPRAACGCREDQGDSWQTRLAPTCRRSTACASPRRSDRDASMARRRRQRRKSRWPLACRTGSPAPRRSAPP